MPHGKHSLAEVRIHGWGDLFFSCHSTICRGDDELHDGSACRFPGEDATAQLASRELASQCTSVSQFFAELSFVGIWVVQMLLNPIFPQGDVPSNPSNSLVRKIFTL